MTQPAGQPSRDALRKAGRTVAVWRIGTEAFPHCDWAALEMGIAEAIDAEQAPAMLALLRRLKSLPLGPGVHLRELKEDTEALLATFDGGGGIQPAADRP